jgi:hypothetical protein
MKAITIHQPWATLIALGEKEYETRSWPTKYRGPIAIHAGMKLNKEAIQEKVIYMAILEHGHHVMRDMPQGAIVATAVLEDCIKSVETWTDGYVLENGVYVYSPEYDFGDFTPGRYAWKLSNVKMLPEPIPAKGQQGLWNWETCTYA